jgi:beta-lactam-binding protein with PASTA domain
MRRSLALLAAVGASAAIAAPVSVSLASSAPQYKVPKPCEVPKVVGLSLATAELRIVDAGCSVGKIKTRSSATVPAGDVVRQNPKSPASGPLGKKVNLEVSLGSG